MYAVVDIETTGGSSRRDRITEIAIFIYDGCDIVDSFVTLINPERSIPYFITRLTGITDQMVANAPRFCEVAKKIVEITENITFVAHNVNFDYNFIRQEFMKLGYEFRREKLCTLQLSRKMVPGFRSYGLGNICKELSISINHRHRAAGDAVATVKLLHHLLQLQASAETVGSHKKIIPPELELVQSLPETTGVYYLLNDKNEAIYIGKSLNIRERVRTHLMQNNSRRAIDMKNATAGVGFEETGSELLALLLESHEIKRLKPLFNRRQRRTPAYYGLFTISDDAGYINLLVDKTTRDETPLAVYPNKISARDHLFQLTERFGLCQKLCGLYHTQGACFQYSIKICGGACIGVEAQKDYNQRVSNAISSLGNGRDNLFIVDKGRHSGERSVVKLEHGKYQGFGYFDPTIVNQDPAQLNDCIRHFEDNRDVQQIIRLYLREQKVEELISF
jgi:DNA polymerase III subunit epsilon